MKKTIGIVLSAFALGACSRTPEPAGTGATTGASAPTVAAAPSAAIEEAKPTGAPGTAAPLAVNSGVAPTALPNAGPKTMSWTAPKGWTTAPNPNTFRKETFKIPGKAGEAELSISESGGSLEDNIARWEKQFGEAKAKTATRDVAGLKVTTVELRGTYANSMGMGAAAKQSDSMMLGAIVATETPHFFKLTGPEKTVLAAKPQWEEFIKSFRPGT